MAPGVLEPRITTCNHVILDKSFIFLGLIFLTYKMRRPGLICREIKNPVASVHMGFGKFGLSWYPWRYSIKSMSRNILDVKVWTPKESKESKTLNLTQESRSKTASVIDLRN